MKPLLCCSLLLALCAGCQTPPPVKTLSSVTRAESKGLAKAYQDDLDGVATYLSAYKTSVAGLRATGDRINENAHAAFEAWKAAAELNVRLQVLAAWDERAMQTLTQDFPQFVLRDYFPRINARVRPMRAELQSRAQAAANAAGNSALAFDEAKAFGTLATTELQAARDLIDLYDLLNAELARGRAALVKKLELEKVTTVRPAKLVLRAAPAAATVDLSADKALVALKKRKGEVADAAGAQDEALQGLDYYLQNDGYTRVLAKEAVAGLAGGLVSETAGQLHVAKLPAKVGAVAKSLGLPAEGAADLTEKLTEQLLTNAQSGLEKLFNEGLAQVETLANNAFNKLKDTANTTIARREIPNP